MLTQEQLHTLAFSVTPDIVKGYPHLMELWKAMLGGYVLPEMAKAEPETVAGNAGFQALVDQYTKENIEKLFAPEVEEKVVEKIVELPTIVEKTVVVREGDKVVHRRLRTDIHKISRKKRQLNSYERDLVINVFNEKQDMLDSTSEVLKTLVDVVNSARLPEEYVSASQLAGYWSSLCRWADRDRARRLAWIAKSLKKEIYTITPVYTDVFIAKIKENYAKKAEETVKRKADHAEIKRTGERRKVIVSEVPAKEPIPAAELDLTDIC
jgi:hypothetical protein